MFILHWIDYNLTCLSRHGDPLLVLFLVGAVIWDNIRH
jgi:hypothetical protein